MPTLVRPTVQHPVAVSLDMAAVKPEQSRTMPPPSTSYAPSPSGNTFVPRSHPVHLRNISLPLARTPPSQPTGPTYVQTHSRSFKRTSASGSVGPASAKSEPMDIDIDPPTLDLRALTLTRAAGASKTPLGFLFNRKTASAPHSPPPPLPPPPLSPTRPAAAAAEDNEIEDLYGPPLGLPSIHAPLLSPPRESSRPLRLPEPKPEPPPPPPPPVGPRLLPVLAAEDPRTLATLERHERREAARPRQGMCKAQAVRRAGAKRGGFVLVAEAEAARARPVPCREPHGGVFASYFAAFGSRA